MPYVTNEMKVKLTPAIKQLAMDLKIHGNKKGNLNFAITTLLLEHLNEVGICYDTADDVHGVISDIAKEYYRRVVAPYEDKKIKENGDLPLFKEFESRFKGGN